MQNKSLKVCVIGYEPHSHNYSLVQLQDVKEAIQGIPASPVSSQGSRWTRERMDSSCLLFLTFCLDFPTSVMNALSCLGVQEMWELWQGLKGMMIDTTDTFQPVLPFKSDLLN